MVRNWNAYEQVIISSIIMLVKRVLQVEEAPSLLSHEVHGTILSLLA